MQETKRGGGIPVPPRSTSPTAIDTDPRKPWSDYCSAPPKLVEGIVEGSTYRNQRELAGCITTAFSESMESLHVSSSAVSGICWVFHKPEENLDERGISRDAAAWLGGNMRTARGYPDALTITHSTPKTFSYCLCIASMAAAQDVEHLQMSLNSCVDEPLTNDLTFLKVTHYYSTGPSASQSAGRGCGNLFFSVAMLAQKPSFHSAQITESQGSTSELLRVEVTGMCLNPNSLMP